jgi:glycosyltransferase involved in cell wall biosynthesis
VARILMVTQPTDGGVFQHVARLCAGLAERGHEPMLAGPFDGVPAGVSAEVLPLELVRSVAPGADARAVAATARLIRRVRPALVHAHSSKAGAATRLARPAYPRTPLAYTPHGFAFASYFGSASERRLYRTAERMLAPLTTVLLCVCDAEARLAASVGGGRRSRVVHNGIPDPPDMPADPVIERLRERGPVVAVLTLLRPGKGLETLIDGMPALLREHPDAQVVVAGDGAERSGLELRARERGVEGSVHLIGAVDGAMQLLAGADVFVSASWAESFPYNVLEAMAAGVPVVATDVGGTAEAVEHGTTGLIVPPRDSERLAAAIGELLRDRTWALDMGHAGRERQRRLFTLDRMIDQTLQVYDECADLTSKMTSCGGRSTS